MDAGQIKAFRIKYKSLQRTYKQHQGYKTEFQAYDINEVSQDKRKTDFYQESKLALEHVQAKLIQYCQQLNAFMNQNKQLLKDEEQVKDDYQKAKQLLQTVKAQFPASN